MKKRGDACACIQRFLSHFPRLKVAELDGLRYEDDVCFVECADGVIRAYSYEIIGSDRYRIGECVMAVW